MPEDAPAEIPRSGYRITRTVSTSGSGRLLFRIRKERQPCTVRQFHTDEGSSGPFELTLDAEVIVPDEEIQLLQAHAMPTLRPSGAPGG